MKKIKTIPYKLSQIKYRALELRKRKQLPYVLVANIMDLSIYDDEKYVQFLLDLTSHYLRVRNYYKKFPHIEEDYNREIEIIINQRKESK